MNNLELTTSRVDKKAGSKFIAPKVRPKINVAKKAQQSIANASESDASKKPVSQPAITENVQNDQMPRGSNEDGTVSTEQPDDINSAQNKTNIEADGHNEPQHNETSNQQPTAAIADDVNNNIQDVSTAPLDDPSLNFIPPKVEISVRDVAVTSMKSLIANKLADGKISKEEQRRRAIVKASRGKRKAQEEPTPSECDVPTVEVEMPDENTNRNGVQLTIVNGNIRIDESSLLVQHDNSAELASMPRIEESSQRYVTSFSFRNRKKLRKLTWTIAMTDRFFEGLSFFGTNFNLIALMFPGLTRNHIKLKFSQEEANNARRVTEALRNKKIPTEAFRQSMLEGLELKKATEKEFYPSVKVEAVSVPQKVDLPTIPDEQQIVPPEDYSQANDAPPESEAPILPEVFLPPQKAVLPTPEMQPMLDSLRRSHIAKPKLAPKLASARPRVTNK